MKLAAILCLCVLMITPLAIAQKDNTVIFLENHGSGMCKKGWSGKSHKQNAGENGIETNHGTPQRKEKQTARQCSIAL